MRKLIILILAIGAVVTGVAQANTPKKFENIECFAAVKGDIDASENKMIYDGNSSFIAKKDNIDVHVTFRNPNSAIVRITDSKKSQDVSFSAGFDSDESFQLTSYSMKLEVMCQKI